MSGPEPTKQSPMPADGQVGTITLIDGSGTRQAHGLVRSFRDDRNATRWEIQIDHAIIEDPRITALGFREVDVVDFKAD